MAMFLYIGIPILSAWTTQGMGSSFENNISITWLLTVSTVELEVHKIVVCGFLCRFVATFFQFILQLLSNTSAFLFSRWICLFVGMHFPKVAKSYIRILRKFRVKCCWKKFLNKNTLIGPTNCKKTPRHLILG